MAAKRRFGRIRKLPSGRWQARYRGLTESTGPRHEPSRQSVTPKSG
jgi:hypothetical protein